MSRTTPLVIAMALLMTPALLAQEVPYEDSRSLRSGSSTSWLEFDVEQDSLYEVKATSLAFVPIVQVERDGERTNTLRAREGEVLQEHVVSSGSSSLRLGVGSADGNGGDYLISIRQVATEDTLSGESDRRGSLTESDGRGTRGRVDWYRFQPNSGSGPFEVSLTSDAFDTFLRVYNADGSESTNDDGGENRNSKMTISPGVGPVFIGVTSFGSNAFGDYELSISRIEPTASISTGQTVSGNYGSDDSPADHLYTIEGEPGTQIVIELESSQFDTVLHASTPEGSDKRNDDAPGNMGTNSQLFLALGESGQALARVDRFGSDSGRYQLSVLEYVGSGDTSRREEGYVLSSGETLEQVITESHRDSEGRLAHRYRYQAERGEEITISLTSDVFDTFLIVNGPEGERWENDDGGNNRNSQLTFTAGESGYYEVIATSFGRDGVGPYTIELQSR